MLLESACWRSEDEFYTCGGDGSLAAWDAETGAQIEAPHTPYGPFPCQAVHHKPGWSCTRLIQDRM